MTDERRILEYVEIDFPYCDLTYGVSPCEAELGVTGEIKCFNSLGTCQDRGNFRLVGFLPEIIADAPVVAREQHNTHEGSPATANLSSAPAEGNLLVAITFHRGDHGDVSISGDGWTEAIRRTTLLGQSNDRRGMAVFWKIAGESEPTAITTTWSGGSEPATNKLTAQEFSVDDGEWDFLSAESNDNGDEDNATSISTGSLQVNDDVYALLVTALGIRTVDTISSSSWVGDVGDEIHSEGGSNGRAVASAYGVTEGVGFKSSTASWTGDNTGVSAGIVAFGIKPRIEQEEFPGAGETVRFAKPSRYRPTKPAAIESIRSISYTPAVVSLGEDLGQRGTLAVTFEDHPWTDTGPGGDKYIDERPYNAYDRGSYWAKVRARYPSLRGARIRLVRGSLGQAYEDMERRHFVIDSYDGPDADGSFSVVAKDTLKLADGDRAQAPRLSNGFLSQAITDSDTELVLVPSGIGDAEYPLSGWVAIGGTEIASFTRAGDTLTLTARGEFNTEAVAHDQQDRVQVVLRYNVVDAAEIIADLLENYADVPAEWIPLQAWLDETQKFNGQFYSATIAEPTAVRTLVSEIVEQAGLALWWDDVGERIRLRVIRAIPTTAGRFVPSIYRAGTIRSQDQPAKRVSQIWTHFGQINPLDRIDEPNNFRSVAATVDLDAERDFGSPAIKKIYSRWIPEFARPVATRLNDIILNRYRVPPRRFNWQMMRFAEPEAVLGAGYRIEGWFLQDATGDVTDAPVQIVRVRPDADIIDIEAEEMLAIPLPDISGRVIIVDANVYNFNLRSVHDTIYPEPVGGDPGYGEEVTCIIEEGVIVGGNQRPTRGVVSDGKVIPDEGTDIPSFDVGEWPANVDISIINRGAIIGVGGRGGNGIRMLDILNCGFINLKGWPGGTALYSRYDVALQNLGLIGGGGAGGAGGGRFNNGAASSGGGGAGSDPGPPGLVAAQEGSNSGEEGQPGTLEDGGSGGTLGREGGDGGGLGQDGEDATCQQQTGDFRPHGGRGGRAIDGDTFITFDGPEGDIRGARIN